jgi:cell wall-associated NlpC family hydrolase
MSNEKCEQVDEDAPSSDIIGLARQYIDTPYRWGGRSPLGIDCSGFVQNVFLVMGTELPRDAWQQAEKGETVAFVEEAQTGDLAYFDNAEGSITHVGIVIREEEKLLIIHASGKVRIDKLDHQGIFAEDTEEYTHQLRLIKRIQL